MSSESKRRAKAQRREARKRTEKTRRQLADHCAEWIYDAEDAWFAKDFPRAAEFTFDQSGFPEVWAHGNVAPAADVALRLR